MPGSLVRRKCNEGGGAFGWDSGAGWQGNLQSLNTPIMERMRSARTASHHLGSGLCFCPRYAHLSCKICHILVCTSVTVSERLRRWTRNPLGSARRGSNQLGVDAFSFTQLSSCPVEKWTSMTVSHHAPIANANHKVPRKPSGLLSVAMIGSLESHKVPDL